ncbi:MAG: Rrf2 family transcriptional regulator [Candidatus Krumholzibacteriia bacterium]
MVSRTAKYALKVLGFLVGTRGSRVPGGEIARLTGVPANYLSKILNQLRKQGIVEAEKGWGGGFELRPEALRRPIRDVLIAIEGPESVDRKDCVFGLPECDVENPCPLHPWWEKIKEVHADMLENATIADLAG